MVMTRSPGSIILDMALSIVVLPEPVPPEMTTLNRHAPAIFSTVAILSDMEPPFAIMSMVIGFSENLRIEIAVPLSDRGGTMTLTREPSARRASARRSEEHTPELQSLMRTPYAVFCLKNQKTDKIPDKLTIIRTN